MRFKQIIETTSAGSVATVAMPMMTQTRENTNVKGLKPVDQMKKVAKKKGPYSNSITESKVKELSIDLTELTTAEFQKKYGKTKAEIKASMTKVNEDDLAEQDLIVIPGQGRLRKTGFVKHDLDQGEHEGHTLKNSLHTIARAASDLDKRLSVQSEFPEWVSEKIGAAKGMMVTVMDYLISSQEMQHDRDAVNEGEGSVQYNELNQDNKNLIIDRARDKADGIYSFRGIMFRVRNGKVTHWAVDGKILQAMGHFNTPVGTYERGRNSQAKVMLKSIKEGVAEGIDAAWAAAKEKVSEGSVPKEKQKTPYVDRNSPESKEKIQAARDKIAKDKAAEPGKQLADKIANNKKA